MMGYSEIVTNIVSLAKDFAQVGALFVGAYVALRGLQTWRRQLIGQKRIELAEETLVAATNAFAAIREIRNPMSFQGEGSSRPQRSGESEEETASKNSYFTPIERLRQKTDTFDRLRELRTRCEVHFGEEMASHLDILVAAPIRIAVSARALINSWRNFEPRNEQAEIAHRSNVDKWEGYIWDHGEQDNPDEYTQKLLNSLAEIKSALGPHIK